MINFEREKITSSDEGKTYDKYAFVMNGEVIGDSWASKEYDGNLSGGIYDLEAVEKIHQYRFSDINNIEALSLHLAQDWNEYIDNVQIILKNELRAASPTLRFEFKIHIEHWTLPWSIVEYAEMIRLHIENQKISSMRYFRAVDNVLNGLGIDCQIRSLDNNIGNEIRYWCEIIRPLLQDVTLALVKKTEGNSVATIFNFPPNVQTACEQYLLYFIQFLRDIGIDATADLKHSPHGILFSVTPIDGKQALETVREALEIYLRIADDPNLFTEASQFNDLAVRQLEANVLHLKSQLLLSQALIDAKNATIEALQISNFNYRQIINGQIQEKALPTSRSSKDPEPVLDGIVELNSISGKGYTVHLPEILRRLKRRFS